MASSASKSEGWGLNSAPTEGNAFRRRWTIAWGAAILLIAWGIRLWGLGAQSLWFDEGWSWHLARMPLAEMARTTASDRSPPLYYALLYVWIMLAGQSEFAMRFVSALADTAALAFVIAFARALWCDARHDLPALLSGFAYACCPFVVWYAQETRMYALVALLATAATFFLWQWLCFPAKLRYLIAWMALLSGAVYSHYYAIFLLPAHALIVLVRVVCGAARAPWAQVGRFGLATSALVSALVPWLLFASPGFAYDDGFSFPLNTIKGRLAEWVRSFASGGLARPLPEVGWLLFASAVGLGLAGFVSKRRWLALAAVLVLIVGPLLAATVAVRVFYPYRSVFHPRYLIYVVPAACVLLGAAGALRGMRAVAAALIGALWLPALVAYLTDPALQREDTRGAVKHVVEALASDDLVIMARDNFAVTYYWPPAHAASLLALPAGLHGVLPDDQPVLAVLNARQPSRVRLMLWQDDVVDPQRFIESTLWANGYEIGEFNFAQIRLPLYRLTRLPAKRPDFQPVDVVFGAHAGARVTLRRAWLRTEITAGDWFYVVLEWALPEAIDRDYKTFVHVLDEAGNLAFQSDRLPLNALLPMTRWTAQQPMRDAHAMVAPRSLTAGRYSVMVGVYEPLTGQRLPAYQGGRWIGDAVTVGSAIALR
jgi:hypothetical protein